jgi:hypothetical protein
MAQVLRYRHEANAQDDDEEEERDSPTEPRLRLEKDLAAQADHAPLEGRLKLNDA